VTTRTCVTATSAPSGPDGGCWFTMTLSRVPGRLAVTRARAPRRRTVHPSRAAWAVWPERGLGLVRRSRDR
jgi:hypothetical protein